MMGSIFLLLQLAATLFMTGLIWFVQIVHYPLFGAVGPDDFRRYEQRHVRATSHVVAPAMILELLSALGLCWRRPAGISTAAVVLNLVLLASIWISTAAVQSRQHASLLSGFDARVHRALVRGNWFRVAAWTVRSCLVLWMIRAASEGLGSG